MVGGGVFDDTSRFISMFFFPTNYLLLASEKSNIEGADVKGSIMRQAMN